MKNLARGEEGKECLLSPEERSGVVHIRPTVEGWVQMTERSWIVLD
jgi:hypothetical protein